MRPEVYKRARIVLAVISILLGLGMIGTIFTSFGPTPRIGIAFGGLLVVLGALRLYWALRG